MIIFSVCCIAESMKFGPEHWERQLRELESAFRYTPTTCFETFPFPHPTDGQRAAIAQAAAEVEPPARKLAQPHRRQRATRPSTQPNCAAAP